MQTALYTKCVCVCAMDLYVHSSISNLNVCGCVWDCYSNCQFAYFIYKVEPADEIAGVIWNSDSYTCIKHIGFVVYAFRKSKVFSIVFYYICVCVTNLYKALFLYKYLNVSIK